MKESLSISKERNLKILILRKEAVNDEMDSLLSNGTWILVDLPYGSKLIDYKWIF